MFGDVATNQGCIINHTTDDNQPQLGRPPTGLTMRLRNRLPTGQVAGQVGKRVGYLHSILSVLDEIDAPASKMWSGQLQPG
jgi:hypothetical protein